MSGEQDLVGALERLLSSDAARLVGALVILAAIGAGALLALLAALALLWAGAPWSLLLLPLGGLGLAVLWGPEDEG